MAVKGLDIFKLSPKKNCKECGVPTCMAFCMKVAQGALPITKCPYMSEEAIALLSEATAPPMKSLEVAGHKLGGETVLFRHDKTFVSRNLYAVSVGSGMEDETLSARLADIQKVDYDRIGEREYVEFVFVLDEGKGADKLASTVQKAAATGRGVIVETKDPEAAGAVLDSATDLIINGADASNWEQMNAAVQGKAVLGVGGSSIQEIYDTLQKLEKAGNKNLIIDVTAGSIKETFANAVQIRRGAIKDSVRTLGYPSLVNMTKLAAGDIHLQTALAALFTLKYGSILVMEKMSYAESLPLHSLRQNIYTDPQKPMKMEPGIYPLDRKSVV